MKAFKIFTFALFMLCGFSNLQAQNTTTEEEDQLSLNNSTINNQFEYVLLKSGDFRGLDGKMYESVKRSNLITLQKHTNDTLNMFRKELEETQTTVDTQSKEIEDLKTNLTNTQGTLDKTNKEKDSMSLFGIQMSKTNYNILMWSMIGILLALLLLFIYRYKNSNAVTKEAKNNLAEIEEEFEEHRRNALEREQKVRRQLQDELNKQKGS